MLFEALAIDWLKQASRKAVAQQLRISWDEADSIMTRAVRRGLARRPQETPKYVGVDETSFQKRHEYVTVVSDLEASTVLYVGDDRKQESLDAFWLSLSEECRAAIQGVAMDMWEPYIQLTRAHVPDAEHKIVFDKYHIGLHLNQAVDRVRRQEHRALMAAGKDWLKGTKYDWLRNPANFDLKGIRAFNQLRLQVNQVARARSLKETLMYVFDLRYLGVVEKHFQAWYRWARRCHLEPMKQVALMLKRHWANIRTYVQHRITNAGAEAINAKIQRVKFQACGFRNRARFRSAICFHCRGLALYPAGARPGS